MLANDMARDASMECEMNDEKIEKMVAEFPFLKQILQILDEEPIPIFVRRADPELLLSMPSLDRFEETEEEVYYDYDRFWLVGDGFVQEVTPQVFMDERREQGQRLFDAILEEERKVTHVVNFRDADGGCGSIWWGRVVYKGDFDSLARETRKRFSKE